MPTKHCAGAAVVLLLAGGACIPADAQAPKVDLEHFGTYMHALKSSKDPEAQAILKQIADGPADLAREKAACEQAGIPTAIVTPAIPIDQNAAPLYEQWRARLRNDDIRMPPYADFLSDKYIYTPQQIARVQDVFDKHREVFNLLDQATQKPRFVVNTDKINDFSYFANMRGAARELVTQSYLFTISAQSKYVSPSLRAKLYDQAIKTNARTFRVADHVTDQPNVIRYLVGTAIESIGLAGFRQILAAVGPDTEIDNQILQTIRNERPKMSLKEAMTGDAAEALKSYEQGRVSSPSGLAALVDEIPAKSDQPSLTPEELQFSGNILDASEAEYLRRQRKAVAIAGLPVDQRRKQFADTARQYAADDAAQSKNPCLTLVSSGSDVTYTISAVDDRTHADEEVVMAAAAILAEKAKTGQFPATLPDGFVDPFNGKPLGYRREGTAGFVVYSVGKEGKFNGGKPGEKDNRTNTLFRYPAAAAKVNAAG